MIRSHCFLTLAPSPLFEEKVYALWASPSLLERLVGAQLKLWLALGVRGRQHERRLSQFLGGEDIVLFDTAQDALERLHLVYAVHAGATLNSSLPLILPMTADELQWALSKLQAPGAAVELVLE